MSDYLLLFEGGKMPETKEEQDAVMAAWNAWFEEMGSSIKDQGNPFTPAVKSVGPDGSVTPGPGKGPASGSPSSRRIRSTRRSTRPRAAGLGGRRPHRSGAFEVM